MQEKSGNARRGNPEGRSKGDTGNAPGKAKGKGKGKGKGARSREGKGWLQGRRRKD